MAAFSFVSQPAEVKLGQRFFQSAAAVSGLHQEARAFQAFYRAAHGHGIAVYKTVGIQKPHLPPGFAHGPGDCVRGRIIVVCDNDIDQEEPTPVQPRFYQAEKALREQMGRNDGVREGIQNDGIVAGLGPAQKIRAIPRVATHGLRHMEIAPRDFERHRIDIHQTHLNPCARQHGGQGAAGTADHQNVAGPLLQNQAEQGMNIFGQADAKAVGDTLVILSLPIGDSARAVVLGENDFRSLAGQAWLASAAI